MPATPDPAPRRSVSDTVHGELRAEILSGRLAPGDALPSERTLSDSFAVNRHAVREALKRLQQAGLVHIAQGGATRVRDWRAHGGLELLLDLGMLAQRRRDVDVMRAVIELRACIGADAARRCADRAGVRARRRVAQLAEAVLAEPGTEARAARYAELWDAIVDGAGNIAYRLAYNSLVGGLAGTPLELELADTETAPPADLAAVAEAVEAGDPEAAGAAARHLLEKSLH